MEKFIELLISNSFRRRERRIGQLAGSTIPCATRLITNRIKNNGKLMIMRTGNKFDIKTFAANTDYPPNNSMRYGNPRGRCAPFVKSRNVMVAAPTLIMIMPAVRCEVSYAVGVIVRWD